MSELARAIERTRIRRRMSQTALAHVAGVSQSTISRIEQGSNPGADVLQAIARALSVSVDSLITPRRRGSRAA